MFRLIVLCLLLLTSLPTQAATISWLEQKPDGTTAAAETAVFGALGTIQQAKPGRLYTYAPSASNITNDNSAVLDVRACAGPGPTITAWTDINGSDFSAEAFVFACPTGTFSATGCIKVLTDIDGGGVDNLSLDGDDGTNRDATGTGQQRIWMTGVSFPLIAVRHEVDSALLTDGVDFGRVRIDVYCAQP